MNTTVYTKGGGHFLGHFGYRSSENPVFELELEFDISNPYMKFGRNPIKMAELE